MRSASDVERVFELWEQGCSKRAIAAATAVSRTQVRAWIEQGVDAAMLSRRGRGSSGRCDGSCELSLSVDPEPYAYLLGMYLGDGCISDGPRSVFKLRISMCDDYPGIRAECEAAMRAVMSRNRISAVQRTGCADILSYSKHWVCLFPQHGAGRKHDRAIVLEEWQRRIALDRHPDRFVRGLIHSDGCRSINRVTRALRDGPKQYSYARYFFTNESVHIRDLFIEACGRLGVECRYNSRASISVARRESVALLDRLVGPKF